MEASVLRLTVSAGVEGFVFCQTEKMQWTLLCKITKVTWQRIILQYQPPHCLPVPNVKTMLPPKIRNGRLVHLY